ncbi:lipopolysaccharide heptosyltransferase II [Candidatus Pseudothioglobus singularis]
MATPAIENLVRHFKSAEITLIGSQVSIEVLKNHPKVIDSHVLEKKIINLYNFLKNLDKFDIFLSFRGSYRSKFIKFIVSSELKFQFDKNKYTNGHQVEKYNKFINDSFAINSQASNLKLPNKKYSGYKKSKLLGINPGASYGSAKRWHPEKFAEVAIDLSNQFDIIIFGGLGEKDIAKDIEICLIKKGIKNYKNLSTKTSISQLVDLISKLDLFVTGDSGPMHIAAAFHVPTVTIFGPTNEYETSQWLNEKSVIVKKNLACQPCMQRICPLHHHNCMKLIKSEDVLEAVKGLC